MEKIFISIPVTVNIKTRRGKVQEYFINTSRKGLDIINLDFDCNFLALLYNIQTSVAESSSGIQEFERNSNKIKERPSYFSSTEYNKFKEHNVCFAPSNTLFLTLKIG